MEGYANQATNENVSFRHDFNSSPETVRKKKEEKKALQRTPYTVTTKFSSLIARETATYILFYKCTFTFSIALIYYKVFSKETMVLRRWGGGVPKLTFQALALRQSE